MIALVWNWPMMAGSPTSACIGYRRRDLDNPQSLSPDQHRVFTKCWPVCNVLPASGFATLREITDDANAIYRQYRMEDILGTLDVEERLQKLISASLVEIKK